MGHKYYTDYKYLNKQFAYYRKQDNKFEIYSFYLN